MLDVGTTGTYTVTSLIRSTGIYSNCIVSSRTFCTYKGIISTGTSITSYFSSCWTYTYIGIYITRTSYYLGYSICNSTPISINFTSYYIGSLISWISVGIYSNCVMVFWTSTGSYNMCTSFWLNSFSKLRMFLINDSIWASLIFSTFLTSFSRLHSFARYFMSSTRLVLVCSAIYYCFCYILFSCSAMTRCCSLICYSSRFRSLMFSGKIYFSMKPNFSYRYNLAECKLCASCTF